ncbi:MAG TPA: hypothetical protein VFZ68_08720 [Acidimicrobiales bacterium]
MPGDSRYSRLAVAVMIAASCGGGAADHAETGRSSGVDLPEAASDHFGSPPAVRPEVAAANGQVLLVGGVEQAGADALRAPDEAVVVDVSTGDSSTVPAPEADMPTLVVEAVGGVDGFVVIGARCREGDRLPALEPVCPPRSATAFLLRPGADAWEEIPFPDRISPPRTSEPWTFQSLVGATPGGDVFALISSGPQRDRVPSVAAAGAA